MTAFTVREFSLTPVRSTLVDELDPIKAPILLAYGKALYELAYSQSGVMGREEVQKNTQGQSELSRHLDWYLVARSRALREIGCVPFILSSVSGFSFSSPSFNFAILSSCY